MKLFQIGKKRMKKQQAGQDIDHKEQKQRNCQRSFHSHGGFHTVFHSASVGSRPGHPLCRPLLGSMLLGSIKELKVCLTDVKNKRSEIHGILKGLEFTVTIK